MKVVLIVELYVRNPEFDAMSVHILSQLVKQDEIIQEFAGMAMDAHNKNVGPIPRQVHNVRDGDGDGNLIGVYSINVEI